MHIGVIADDITGGTDLASAVREAGLRVVQTIGVPTGAVPEADVVVVSLKTRTTSSVTAVESSLAAARWLRSRGARILYFKYCSTFDSTDRGNIGPVTSALLNEVGEAFTVVCPAYPAQRRTVYQGHLFVGDRLLSETSMCDHPLTPMMDADLVRVLGRQCTESVGLVDLDVLRCGVSATRARFEDLRRAGRRVAVVDATTDQDLATLAAACDAFGLVTGATGLAQALARLAAPGARGADLEVPLPGRTAVVVLSGSCSSATLAQVREFSRVAASRRISAEDSGSDGVAAVAAWVRHQLPRGDVMLYSTADTEDVQRVQRSLGREEAAQRIESAFGLMAAALRDAGVRTFIVAGGETSGVVLEALGIRTIAFRDSIAPGVPAVVSLDPPGFAFALKSGNFGGTEFFSRAVSSLKGVAA